jgi:hypothetical protein
MIKGISASLILAAGLVSARGARADLDVFPNWVNFSDTPVGSVQSRSVTVRNTGHDWVSRVNLWSSGDTDQFRVDDLGCMGLNQFSSCSVRIEYRPTEAGRHGLRIQVSGDLGGSVDTISVQGSAYDPRL